MTLAKVITINRTPGDFVSATQHLTTLEIGAYQMICDQIVERGQDNDPPSLPDDDTILASITRLTVRQWRKIKPRLCSGDKPVLSLANGRVTQIRTAYEVEQARERINGQAIKGRKSGEARRLKAEIRRRFNEPDANTERTAVQTATGEELNRSGTSHESRVMSHEEETTLPSSASFLPADGDEAVAIVSKTLQAIAPRLRADDIAVSLWLRDICRDPWWLAAALCERQPAVEKARTDMYLTTMLQGMKADDWTCEDARGFVEFRLASLTRQAAQ